MKLKNLVNKKFLLENEDVIYRCGWCGLPVDKDGHFLPDVNNYEEADEYLEKHKNAKVIHVNGDCCPYGDQSYDDLDRN